MTSHRSSVSLSFSASLPLCRENSSSYSRIVFFPWWEISCFVVVCSTDVDDSRTLRLPTIRSTATTVVRFPARRVVVASARSISFRIVCYFFSSWFWLVFDTCSLLTTSPVFVVVHRTRRSNEIKKIIKIYASVRSRPRRVYRVCNCVCPQRSHSCINNVRPRPSLFWRKYIDITRCVPRYAISACERCVHCFNEVGGRRRSIYRYGNIKTFFVFFRLLVFSSPCMRVN